MPPWLSPVERLAVNQSLMRDSQSLMSEDRHQSVIGSNPIGGAKISLFSVYRLEKAYGAIARCSLYPLYKY